MMMQLSTFRFVLCFTLLFYSVDGVATENSSESSEEALENNNPRPRKQLSCGQLVAVIASGSPFLVYSLYEAKNSLGLYKSHKNNIKNSRGQLEQLGLLDEKNRFIMSDDMFALLSDPKNHVGKVVNNYDLQLKNEIIKLKDYSIATRRVEMAEALGLELKTFPTMDELWFNDKRHFPFKEILTKDNHEYRGSYSGHQIERYMNRSYSMNKLDEPIKVPEDKLLLWWVLKQPHPLWGKFHGLSNDAIVHRRFSKIDSLNLMIQIDRNTWKTDSVKILAFEQDEGEFYLQAIDYQYKNSIPSTTVIFDQKWDISSPHFVRKK